MKLTGKHSKLFYQYLLSYLVILLLPMVIISVFVYHYMLNLLQTEMQNNKLQTLIGARDTVELQLKNITSIEHSVFLDQKLPVFHLKNDPLEALEVQKELQNYVQPNPMMYDIAYYQAADDYIIMARSSTKKELYFSWMYQYANKTYGKFLQEIRDKNYGFFWGEQEVLVGQKERKNLITYIRPMNGSSAKDRCLIYLLDAAFFTDLFPTDETGGAWAIYDSNGQMIVKKGDWTFGNPQDEQETASTLNKEYLVSHVYSDAFQWDYYALTPKREIAGRIEYIRLLMAFMCLISLVAGGVGIAFFMGHNYMPIKKLATMSNDILKSSNEKELNEIDYVARTLRYLEKQNERLSFEQIVKDAALRERFIIKLLTGQYKTAQEIREKAESLGICFENEKYCVAVFHVRNMPTGLDQNIEELFMNASPKELKMLMRVQQETQRILMILGYHETEETQVDTLILNLVDIMQCDIGLKAIVGVSRSTEDVAEISQSYKEALTALDYRVVLYQQRLIRYEEIMLRQGNVVYNIHPKELSMLIKKRNIDEVENFLKSALEELIWKKADLKQIKRQCSEFTDAIEKVVYDVNRDYFVEKPLYLDLQEIIKYENVKELLEIIRLISCDIIEHLNELSGKSVIESMVLYIQEHCFSCEFSTTAMAEAFQMSLPYLSQYFKSHSGKNLSDYVTELKLEKSKELLRETDEAIKDIAQQVGYYNVNSFNRRFKQMTGVSPGEYRKERK